MSSSALRALYSALLTAVAIASSAPPGQADATSPTEVSVLVVTYNGWALPSMDDAGPGFRFHASDTQGIEDVVATWCSDEVPDYCLSPRWTPTSSTPTVVNGAEAMVDIPVEAPLGMYTFRRIVFTDALGNTTTFLPSHQTLVNSKPGEPHSFELDGGVDVLDEIAPTLKALRWVDGRDWAVVNGDDAVIIDAEVADNWRKPVSVDVGFTQTGGGSGASAFGSLPEMQTGSQMGWTRATGELGDEMRTGGVYELSHVAVRDEQGNKSFYYPDGTLVVVPWLGPTVVVQHELDLASFRLDVRDEVASLLEAAPVADSTLRYSWSPASDTNGEDPDHYTLQLTPLSPAGLEVPSWSPNYWQPSDLPVQSFTVPGDTTTLTVDGLDNGRRYVAELRAHFPNRVTADQPISASPLPRITYSPAVEVIEGDTGISHAVITVRLSSPAITALDQIVSLRRITAWDG